MAARRKLEDVLAALRRARADPGSPEAQREIRSALAGDSGHAAAKAAAVIGELALAGYASELVAAFDRFMSGTGSDPGCEAKRAIVDSLAALGHDDPDVFLRGGRHVQMEPVYGGRVDTAPGLRGACAMALVAMGYRDALVELADLLADREAPARVSAARAIAHRGGGDGVPLLRLRALVGDPEAEVLGECFRALLSLRPAASVPFVGRFLDSPRPDVAEAAALALGESRQESALAALRPWAESMTGTEVERAALLALALLRSEDAVAFLLSRVHEGSPTTAVHAIAALGLYRENEGVCGRVRAAAAERAEPRVREALARAFG